MDDLISRTEALKALCRQCNVESPCEVVCDDYLEIKALPSAHPMQKEAKWKTAYLDHESMGNRPKILYCSRCNQCAAYPTDFCPACGADMRGENE